MPDPVLVIRVKAIGCNPTLDDPQEIAEYFLDPDCDDPPFEYLHAEWSDQTVWS